MHLSVLGAARQVGRSAFLVRGSNTKLLLDYGVLMSGEPAFPVHVQPRDVDAIVLSHAHLDHSGATPLFFLGNGVKMYCTDLTSELTRLLLEDFIKISGFYLPFEYMDLITMMKNTRHVNLGERVEVGDFAIELREAGHIPGGASTIIEHGGKRLLYTGDLNAGDTSLIKGADLDFGELDFVITESTYASSDHPSRDEVENSFVSFAKEVVERGGTLLTPAFSVGRAQEVASVLRSKNFPYPVAMDGMALKTNEILFRYQNYLRDPDLFRKSLENVEIMTSWSQRKRMVKTPSVIISPAGMLVGGASKFYSSEIAENTRNGISMVSFQIPGTPGRTLLDRGLAIIHGKPRRVKAEVKRFDFSSHSGKSELFRMLREIKGNPRVLTIHGEESNCVNFASEIHAQFGFEASAPMPGETFSI